MTFNILNFQTYLQRKAPYVVVRTFIDGTGALRATGFDIVPAPLSGFVGVAGATDAAPVSLGSGVATVRVHVISVIFNPANAARVSKGSFVLAKGLLNVAGAIDTTVDGGRLFVLSMEEDDDDHEVDIGE